MYLEQLMFLIIGDVWGFDDETLQQGFNTLIDSEYTTIIMIIITVTLTRVINIE